MKLKVGDTIQVMIGRDKGKTSKVQKVYPADDRVLVENINQFKRHVKGRGGDQKSEIATITKPLPVSNVALVCPKCKKTTRVGYKVEKGKKVRVCRKCDKEI